MIGRRGYPRAGLTYQNIYTHNEKNYGRDMMLEANPEHPNTEVAFERFPSSQKRPLAS